jgi:ACS family glucarate transporter-like MFS transporter
MGLVPEGSPEALIVLTHPATAAVLPRSGVRWKIITLLALAGFVGYLLRTNMSVAGERMVRDLGLTQVQFGFVLAAFAWGYALFQLPGGILGERLGSRKGLTLIVVAWGVLNALVGLIPGGGALPLGLMITALAALRFLMGAAQAPLFPIMSGESIARWFPVGGWALPNGLTNTGFTLGAAATGPLIAWLVATEGWRLSFVLTAPLAFLMAGAWWWYARDRPIEHRGVSRAELVLIDAGRPDPQAPPSRAGWARVLRDRNLLLITASYFFANYLFYFFFNWLYIYLVDVRKFEVLEGGALAAAPWITGAIGATLGGAVCDWLSRRYGMQWGCRAVSITGLVLAGGFLVAAATAVSPYVAVVFLSLCLAFQQSTDSAAWAATTMVGGRHASAACGVLNTGGNVVGGIGALLVPVTARALGWPVALGTASLCALLGAALWLWIRVEPPAAEPA